MGHGCIPFGEARRRVCIRRVRGEENKYFYKSREQKGVKTKENEGDVLPATDPRGDIAKRAVSERGKKFLNGCEVRDVERGDDEGEERRSEVEGIKSKVK